MAKRPSSDAGFGQEQANPSPNGTKALRHDHPNGGLSGSGKPVDWGRGGPGQLKATPRAARDAPRTMTITYSTDGNLRSPMNKHYRTFGDGAIVEVTIPANAMHGDNCHVKERKIWGDHVYSDDTDVVAAAMHQGFYCAQIKSPPPQVQEFRVRLELLRPQRKYGTIYRNGVRSREWPRLTEGCAFKVIECSAITKSGHEVPLPPCPQEVGPPLVTYCPSFNERQMNTRSSSLGPGKMRSLPEVTVLYNLCNEPWLKYNFIALTDKGLKQHQRTSARLQDEVLFLESHTQRYQIAFTGTGVEQGDGQEVVGNKTALYSWSICQAPLPVSAMKRAGLPLGPQYVEVLEPSLKWEEFKWGGQGLMVNGTEYRIVRYHFLQRTRPAVAESYRDMVAADTTRR